jgi:hypothetical protein
MKTQHVESGQQVGDWPWRESGQKIWRILGSWPCPHETNGMRMVRLALSKGEGEGEGFLWLSGVCGKKIPHLSPLPWDKGRGDKQHDTFA